MTLTQKYSFGDLARVASREVGQRKRVYQNLLLAGKMTKEKADYEIGAMLTIAEHFERLAAEQAAKGDLFARKEDSNG